MNKFFNFKLISDKTERWYGLALRFLGVDLSVSVTGFVNDWRGIHFSAFGEGLLGVYFQFLGLVIYLGRNELLFTDKSEIVVE